MHATVEQTLIEASTTRNPQVVFSAIEPQALLDATMRVIETGRLPLMRVRTIFIHTPLFADLVRGLCHRLWDEAVQWGGGDAFSVFDEEHLERLSENPVVQRAIEQLVPLSKQGQARLRLLIEAYCTNGCTQASCRELGLSRWLDRQDQLDLLAALLRLERLEAQPFLSVGHRGAEPALAEGVQPRLILQVDALERLTHCAPLDGAAFAATLLYLFDALGEDCTLWLNLHGETPPPVGAVKEALGVRFVSRLTHDLTASGRGEGPERHPGTPSSRKQGEVPGSSANPS